MGKFIRSIWFQFNRIILKYLSDSIYYNILFFVNCIRLRKKFYFLKIKKSKTFNEKILTLKAENIQLKALFADKLNLKKGLSELGLEINIPQVIEVFRNKNELLNYDFNRINVKGFVIKANHGSGMNKIFSLGSLPTMKDLVEIGSWFDYDSSLIGREKHYALIDRKVFIEELLDLNIRDYKFHVFKGKVEFVQIDLDRFIGHRRNIYDAHWNLQRFDINYPKADISIEKPKNLQEMVDLAEKISSPNIFGSYVRVDFYVNNNLIYLGEITFHPGGGVEPFDSYESDLYMGSFFNN
jgi:hypothetical protein